MKCGQNVFSSRILGQSGRGLSFSCFIHVHKNRVNKACCSIFYTYVRDAILEQAALGVFVVDLRVMKNTEEIVSKNDQDFHLEVIKFEE